MDVYNIEAPVPYHAVKAREPSHIEFGAHAEPVHRHGQPHELGNEVLLPRQDVHRLVLEGHTIAGRGVLDEQTLRPTRSEAFHEP
jgi:hypothetical protein